MRGLQWDYSLIPATTRDLNTLAKTTSFEASNGNKFFTDCLVVPFILQNMHPYIICTRQQRSEVAMLRNFKELPGASY
jgi:hypothetical protein